MFDVPMKSRGAMSGAGFNLDLKPAMFMTNAQADSAINNRQPNSIVVPTSGNMPCSDSCVKPIKGQKLNLTDLAPDLNSISIVANWGVKNTAYSLDIEAFMLGANNKVLGDDWFVFYGQKCSPDAACVHIEEVGTADGYVGKDTLKMNLAKLNTEVAKVVFILTINDAKLNNYNFAGVKDCFISIIDNTKNIELVRFNLCDYYETVTSMILGELYRKSGTWRFNPVGNGTADDLAGLCARFGVSVDS